MDTVSKEKRSRIMSAIHSRDTLPEVVVRKMLWANGYRFRVCDKRIVGHPGIEPASLLFPALAGGFLTTSATWEPPVWNSVY